VVSASTGSHGTSERLRGALRRHSALLEAIEPVQFEVREIAKLLVRGCFEEPDHAPDVLGARCNPHGLKFSLTDLAEWGTSLGFGVAKVTRDRALGAKFRTYL